MASSKICAVQFCEPIPYLVYLFRVGTVGLALCRSWHPNRTSHLCDSVHLRDLKIDKFQCKLSSCVYMISCGMIEAPKVQESVKMCAKEKLKIRSRYGAGSDGRSVACNTRSTIPLELSLGGKSETSTYRLVEVSLGTLYTHSAKPCRPQWRMALLGGSHLGGRKVHIRDDKLPELPIPL